MPSPSTFLSQLLTEQGQMTAVQEFSLWHESSPAPTSAYHALFPAAPPQPGQQYAFEVELDQCSGCKACVVACHALNGLDESETWRKVGLLNSLSSTLPIIQHLTTACHHCLEPGCLNGCPVLAYEKDPLTGIVRHLDDQCFGCKYCVMMCPYEVPQYNASLGIVRKCDMCAGRLADSEAPACVEACPNQAIKISVIDVDSIRLFNAVDGPNARFVNTAPSNQLTQPSTRYISQQQFNFDQSSDDIVSRECVSDEVQPGHEPLVAMLVLTQTSVGLWCALASAVWFDLLLPQSILSATMCAAFIGFIGVQLALLHLGRPWLAYRSFLGWRRSWLSREAIAFGIHLGTVVCTVAVCLCDLWLSQPTSLAPIAYALSACSGCAAVVCSAMIYVVTRRELWSARRTFVEFGATTVGLGLAVFSLFVDPASSNVLLMGGWTLCCVAFVPKLFDWKRASRTSFSWCDFSIRSGRLLQSQLRHVVYSIFASMFLAICLGSLLPFFNGEAWRTGTGMLAVALLVVSQSLVRWLYFASVVFARMPGAST